MTTASRILGDEVGSTAPRVPGLPRRPCDRRPDRRHHRRGRRTGPQGQPRHIRAGRWYYRAITAVFATATALIAMRWSQDRYLFILGAVTFTAATAGVLHRRRHRPGDTGLIAGMGIAYTAMLTAFYSTTGAPAAMGPDAHPGLLAPARRHRRPPHHPRDPSREEEPTGLWPAGATGSGG